jgi:hypothetical protein
MMKTGGIFIVTAYDLWRSCIKNENQVQPQGWTSPLPGIFIRPMAPEKILENQRHVAVAGMILPADETFSSPGNTLEASSSGKAGLFPGFWRRGGKGQEGCSQWRKFQPPFPFFSGPDDTVSPKNDTVV